MYSTSSSLCNFLYPREFQGKLEWADKKKRDLYIWRVSSDHRFSPPNLYGEQIPHL